MTKLSKKICRKCWNERAREENNNRLLWNEDDENSWKEGRVICSSQFTTWESAINCEISTDQTPDCCSYKLEHVVLSEKPK